MPESTQHKLDRIRPPRVQITYDVEIGGAIQKKELPLVMGILAADNNVWLMLGLLVLGASALLWFFRSVRAKEKAGHEPLISTSVFRNRTSNLGLVTQLTQWLLLMGTS